jgi:PAS domain S-box-containing protein
MDDDRHSFEGPFGSALLIFDRDSRLSGCNREAERLLGYDARDMIGKSGALFFTPEEQASGAPEEEIRTALNEGQVKSEREYIRKDGTRLRVVGTLSAIRNASEIVGFAKVLHESAQETGQLSRERVALLRQVQHQVNNNLQLIISLINIQLRRAGDRTAGSPLESTLNRIRTIAQMHERVYTSPDFATVLIGAYLEHLVGELSQTYNTAGHVKFDVQAADLALDMPRAIALALISNEIVADALQHAFPEGRSGMISVRLNYCNGGESTSVETAELRIAHNGIPGSEAVNAHAADSIQPELVRILVSQLRAEWEANMGVAGTSFRIRFSL